MNLALEPLSFYLNNVDSPLLFHLLNVGQGLMSLIIFPDNTVMVYDCNITENNQDSILQYLGKNIPDRYNSKTKNKEKWIDIFVCSHRDIDHIRGLNILNKNFEIHSIWDSEQSGASTSSNDYEYYMHLKREIKDKYGDCAIFTPKASENVIKEVSGAQIFCISPYLDCDTDIETKKQHTNCIVLIIKYSNKSILLTGDSDWYIWKNKIVPNFSKKNFLKSQILIASHHGSRSFFTETNCDNDSIDIEKYPDTTYLGALDFIKPIVTLISCGECKEPHNLPNKEAIKIYKEKTGNSNDKQVLTTYDKGTIVAFIKQDGSFGVIPSRFKNINNPNFTVKIVCQTEDGIRIEHKSTQPKGLKLKYTLKTEGGLLDPIDKLSVYWEVSNCGTNIDECHQEVYCKNKHELDEKLCFSRNLEYEGRHLLRCRIINKNKNVDITKIFIINCK